MIALAELWEEMLDVVNVMDILFCEILSKFV